MYILEGTIGAGKSTFLKLLAQYLPDLTVKLEPVDIWQSQEHGQSLLTNFYENPTRWAYTLETFTMICRVQEHRRLQKALEPIIIERSIYSGHYVFARNSYESGFLNNLEWHLYNQFFNFLTSRCTIPQGFIYLQTSPEIAYERIKKRNRSSEISISLDYLHQLNHQHEKFLCQKEDILPSLKDVPVLIIDCNKEFELDIQQFKQHCSRIQEFIEKIDKVHCTAVKIEKSSNL
jgi:deoxyguanosine kinase